VLAVSLACKLLLIARSAPAPRAHRATRSAPAPRAHRATRSATAPRAPRATRSQNAAPRGHYSAAGPGVYNGPAQNDRDQIRSDRRGARVFSALAIVISSSAYDRLGCSRPPLLSVPFRARVFSALPPLITTTRAFSVVILRSELGCSRLCLRSLQRLGRSRSLSGVLGSASAHDNDSGVLGRYPAYLRYRFLTHPR